MVWLDLEKLLICICIRAEFFMDMKMQIRAYRGALLACI